MRGYEPQDAGQRREHRRRYALEQLHIEVDTLPVSLQRLVLGHHGTLPSEQRRRLANALLRRDIDVGRIGLVLQLLGDAPSGDADLAALVLGQQIERERAERLSDNFTVTGVQRGYRRLDPRPRPHFFVRVRLDEQPAREVLLDLVAEDLAALPRFRAQCIKQAAFMPLFKEGLQTFQRFVDTLLEPLRQEDTRA